MRLQVFNEKDNFRCQCAHLFLFPNVKLKEHIRVPVLGSCLVYDRTPGPQQAWRELEPSWEEAHGPSAAPRQPVIRGNVRSPWAPGLRTLPAGLSGWAVGTAERLVQESLLTHHQRTSGSGFTQPVEKTTTGRAGLVLLAHNKLWFCSRPPCQHQEMGLHPHHLCPLLLGKSAG